MQCFVIPVCCYVMLKNALLRSENRPQPLQWWCTLNSGCSQPPSLIFCIILQLFPLLPSVGSRPILVGLLITTSKSSTHVAMQAFHNIRIEVRGSTPYLEGSIWIELAQRRSAENNICSIYNIFSLASTSDTWQWVGEEKRFNRW